MYVDGLLATSAKDKPELEENATCTFICLLMMSTTHPSIVNELT